MGQECRHRLYIEACCWIRIVQRDSCWNTTGDTYRYTVFVASRMSGDGTSSMIESFLIHSWLANFHHSAWCGCTAGAGVHLFGSGGQPSAQIWGKCLTNHATNWKIGCGITHMPSGIKLIAPNCSQLAWGWLTRSGSIAPDTVAIISQQRLSRQAANSISQMTSWPFDNCTGIR